MSIVSTIPIIPTVNQAEEQVIEVPSNRLADATQIFDTQGNVLGTPANPLYVVQASTRASHMQETTREETHVSPTEAGAVKDFDSLLPIRFLKGTSSIERWGLDAEQIKRDCPSLVREVRGHVYYDLVGILAILLAKVKQQDEHISYLLNRKE